MKNEPTLHELLCAYVLGEASPEEASRVEAELRANEELRAERARLEATIGLVQETLADEETLSAGAHAELMGRAGLAGGGASLDPPGLPRPLWQRVASNGVARLAAAVLLLATGAYVLVDVVRPDGPAPEGRAGRSGRADRVAVAERNERAQRELRDGAKSAREERTSPRQELAPIAERVKGERELEARLTPPPSPAESAPAGRAAGDFGKSRANEADRLSELGYLSDDDARDANDLESLGYAGDPSDKSRPDEVVDDTKSDVASWSPHPDSPPLEHVAASRPELPPSPKADSSAATRPTPPSASSGRGGAPGSEGMGLAGGPLSGPSGPSGPGASAGKEEASGGKYGGREIGVGRRSREPGAEPLPAPSGGADARGAVDDLDGLLAGLGHVEEARRTAGADDFFLGEGEPARRLGNQEIVDRVLQSCRRRPNESPSMMFFRFWGDNAFELARLDPLSTFSVDVDTASYALARNYLTRGMIPPKAAVRTEEFVNYFDADVPAPLESDFAVHTDLAPSLFGGAPDRWMLRVVVRGREVAADQRQPLALTFVVDTSGSMQQENRMALVQHALRLLVGELDANDSIALVAFSREARQILPMTSAANRGTIEVAINALKPGGSTNGEAGLKLGYATASDAAEGAPTGAAGVTHRVVFLSDGVVNTGQTDQARILADVERFRARGIYLNTIGVGMGNHNDVFLEQLADRGDGMCNYIDSEREAYRAIVENFTGAFQPIARDVKVQVEFDPAQVESYRLLGYENRAIRDADFRNDAVDAGEVGAGHQVTALYELVRIPGEADSDAPLAVARLRWKPPHGAEGARDPEAATELAHVVEARDASGSFEATSAGYRRAVLVAQFAEFLRRSVHARGDSLDTLIEEAKRLATELDDPDFTELALLAMRSRQLILSGLAPGDELTRAVDALRHQHVLMARYEALLDLEKDRRRLEDAELLETLARQNQELEERIRELVRRRLEDR